MKRLRFISITIACVVALCLVGFAAVRASDSFLSSDQKSKDSRCAVTGQTHSVEIKNSQVIPKHTQAKLCDKLEITNLDTTERLMAFGQHEHHTSYDGVTERLLSKGQSVRVTLVATGTYTFHDHENDDVQGSFTVQ